MNVELICLTPTDLSHRIATKLHRPLHTPIFQQFADGELNVVLQDPGLFYGKTVVIIQSTGAPVNEHLLGVAYCAHELKNAGAHKVIAVIPYFGYARQEASLIPGKPGHAAVVISLLEGAGIDELVTVELHDESLLSLFSIPIHNLNVQSIIADHIKRRLARVPGMKIIAPDQGARAYADAVAHTLGVTTLICEKERYAKDKTRVIDYHADGALECGIMIDDIISTGGTAVNVCTLLYDQGCVAMYGYFVHPVLAGPALERLQQSHFSKIFVGNTLPLSLQAQATECIEQFDVSEAILTTLQGILYENICLPHSAAVHRALQ